MDATPRNPAALATLLSSDAVALAALSDEGSGENAKGAARRLAATLATGAPGEPTARRVLGALWLGVPAPATWRSELGLLLAGALVESELEVAVPRVYAAAALGVAVGTLNKMLARNHLEPGNGGPFVHHHANGVQLTSLLAEVLKRHANEPA